MLGKVTLSALIGVLTLTSISMSAEASNIYRKNIDTKTNISIPAFSKGQSSKTDTDTEQDDGPATQKETINIYDYRTDAWAVTNAPYGWRSIYGSSYWEATSTSFTIKYDGQYSGLRALWDRSKGSNALFTIQPNDDFDISFDAYVTDYSNQISARFFLQTSTDNTNFNYNDRLISWGIQKEHGRYDFQTPIGNVDIANTHLSRHRYRVLLQEDIMTVFIDGQAIAQNTYSITSPVTFRFVTGVKKAGLRIDNLEMSIKRTVPVT